MTAVRRLAAEGEPLSGWIKQGVHYLPVRLYYEDTDAGGIVYHANYLRYAERARTEMLRLVGVDQSRMRREQGLAFAVRDCALDFKRPARLDDLIEVRSFLTEMTAATVSARQGFWRGEELLVRLDVRVVCISAPAKAVRIPAPIRAALKPYLA